MLISVDGIASVYRLNSMKTNIRWYEYSIHQVIIQCRNTFSHRYIVQYISSKFVYCIEANFWLSAHRHLNIQNTLCKILKLLPNSCVNFNYSFTLWIILAFYSFSSSNWGSNVPSGYSTLFWYSLYIHYNMLYNRRVDALV